VAALAIECVAASVIQQRWGSTHVDVRLAKDRLDNPQNRADRPSAASFTRALTRSLRRL